MTFTVNDIPLLRELWAFFRFRMRLTMDQVINMLVLPSRLWKLQTPRRGLDVSGAPWPGFDQFKYGRSSHLFHINYRDDDPRHAIDDPRPIVTDRVNPMG